MEQVDVSEPGIFLVSQPANPVEEIPTTSLESILPLLRCLPALVLEQSTYHLRGPISKPDFQEFSVHARRVGEFTLSSNHDNSSTNGFTIAPGTFVRLGQLQNRDSPGPLLPSLKRLRLINPDEWSMSQLPLFFTPSLRSLEATNVPENQQSAFLSFLITLVHESPRLNSITLGPGVLTTACLEACSNFLFLRQLELKDVNVPTHLKFLTAIGKLPELDTLVWDDRSGYYPGSDEEPLPKIVGFFCLKKLHITGTLALIRLFYDVVGSMAVEDLGLTLVRKSAPQQGVPSGGKRKKSMKGTSARRASSPPPGENDVDSMTREFCDLLQQGSWRQTLKRISLNHQLQTYDDWREFEITPKHLRLPITILDVLLDHTNLRGLEITGWTLPDIDSAYPALLRNTSIKHFPGNLETLRLPDGSSISRIPLLDLQSIAQSHPNLVVLQCGIESLSNFASPPLSTQIPSHGLKVLSVGTSPGAAETIDWKQKLSIAAFLDTLFPNLERIETEVGASHAEDWRCIHDLVKMCQTSRLIHATRQLVSSPIPEGDGK